MRKRMSFRNPQIHNTFFQKVRLKPVLVRWVHLPRNMRQSCYKFALHANSHLLLNNFVTLL